MNAVEEHITHHCVEIEGEEKPIQGDGTPERKSELALNSKDHSFNLVEVAILDLANHCIAVLFVSCVRNAHHFLLNHHSNRGCHSDAQELLSLLENSLDDYLAILQDK